MGSADLDEGDEESETIMARGFRLVEVEVSVESMGWTSLLTEGIEMEVIMLASSRARAPWDLRER